MTVGPHCGLSHVEALLVVTGPHPGLGVHVGALVCAGVDIVVCDVTALTDPDLRDLDTLLRAALTAKRAGGRIRLVNLPPRLLDLLACTGLTDVLGLCER